MPKNIKALLLAAGFGTRLRPITNNLPKCLVPIGGKPLLDRWLTNLESCGCDETIINTHYMANQVEEYIRQRKTSKMKISLIHEPILLGTAKTLLANIKLLKSDDLFIIHADNATDTSLSELLIAHRNRPKECKVTMLTFTTDNPSSCGIVEVDEKNVIKRYFEKKDNPPGNKANGAVYIAAHSIWDEILKINPPPNDISNDIVPKLIGKILTHHTKNDFIDIGNPKNLRRAQELWRN